jgi:bifunctional UDP-N-acetylglucosamine pyrophosphorylase/glucosamine-1-phosphate N-acetyltransferase
MAEKLIIIANEKNQASIKDLAQPFNATVVLQKGKGQAAALLSAKNEVQGEVLVLNNNDLYDSSLFEKIVDTVDRERLDCLLVCTKVKEYFPGGYLTVEGEKVVGIVEKPGPNNMPSDYFRLVVDYFASFEEFISLIDNVSDPEIGYEAGIERMIAQDKNVGYVIYDGMWTTIKYPWHVLATTDFFLENISSHMGENVSIDPTAKISGKVYLEDGVKIYANAQVVGPAYIGKNTVIGSFALVIGSMIGERCIVGGYAEVTRSYLGQNVLLHRNYVGDSVLERNILFGAGAVTANFRFDEGTISSVVKGEKVDTRLKKLGTMIGQGVKVGVNSSIMPGVKIGSDIRVTPGEVVKKDIVS